MHPNDDAQLERFKHDLTERLVKTNIPSDDPIIWKTVRCILRITRVISKRKKRQNE